MPQTKTNQEELDYYQEVRDRVLLIMQEQGFENNPKAFAEQVDVEYLMLYNFISSRSSRPKLLMLRKILLAFPSYSTAWFFGVQDADALFEDYRPMLGTPSLSQEAMEARSRKADQLILRLIDENNQLKNKLIDAHNVQKRVMDAFTSSQKD